MNARMHDPIVRAPVAIRAPGLIDYLWSTLLWLLGVLWIVPTLVLLTVLHTLLPIGIVERLDRIYIWGQVRLLLCRWRAVVHEDVDPNQPYIFMQNHTNHFDHVMMYNATSHIKQGLELRQHFKYPFYGWFMKSRGTVPVDKGRQGQSARVMDHIRSEIDKGHSILAFPEGTRTLTGHVEALRRGTFFIARDLGVPIVPVTVTGTYEVMQKGSLVLRPFQTITVHYGAPIEATGVHDDDLDALVAEVHAAMSAPLDAYWAELGHTAPVEGDADTPEHPCPEAGGQS